MCEDAFTQFAGILRASSRQWSDVKKELRAGFRTSSVLRKEEDRQLMRQHCVSYIQDFAETNCDKVATASAEEFCVLPYGSIKQFYDEYKHSFEMKGQRFASLSTFTNAYLPMSKR